jgi:hypothetical protein
MGKVPDPFLCDDRYIMGPGIWDHKLVNGTRQIYKDVLAIRILNKYKFGMIFAFFVATSLVVPCAGV